MLFAMRDAKIPTMVVHGENDQIVPFDCARDMAKDADGTLYMVPAHTTRR
jgi:pimeloyl-ACP methyl ester carboxylesterase